MQHYDFTHFPSERKLDTFAAPEAKISDFDPNITTVMLRLNRVKILNVHDGFFDHNGEIYFISSICDGLSDTPIKVEEQVPWQHVKAGDFLDILPPGIVLYESSPGQLPEFLDWRFVVMDSDAGVRHYGDLLKQVGDNSTFSGIQSTISTIMTSVNPILTAVLGLADAAFSLIGSLLGGNQDDFVGKGAVTFTKVFDNFGVPVGQKSQTYPAGDNLIRVGDFEFQFTLEVA